MLIIARKKNESIFIGDDVEIVISELSRSVVKVAISAPRGTRVLRGEIREAILLANRAATETASQEGAVATENLAAFVGSSAKTTGAANEKIGLVSNEPREAQRVPAPSIRVGVKEEEICPLT
ncbi:MAG: carbon storage regulator [Polyangiaceae bacterium]|nr:carbon storage regulator [Polyangiaceae bacterium]